MSETLYRKYRSKNLSEVVGQDHITRVLSRALETGRIAHAYLLTGPRGVGKTSIARILAHEINKLPYADDTEHLDIIEIDAASNNSVEDIRDLREKVRIAPVNATKKIYIIDEVHMLSKQAFNALLKTLEEPPEHIVFILATTDVQKLPDTILSRVQQFRFKSIATDVLASHLRTIANLENIHITDEALQIVAQRGGGSFRDSISILDQISTLSDKDKAIDTADIYEILGIAPDELIDALLAASQSGDIATILRHLESMKERGVATATVAGQLIRTAQLQLAEHPSLILLIDNLTEVPRNSHPEAKLLVALAKPSVKATATEKPATQPKTVALATPIAEVKASVAELKKAPTAPKKVIKTAEQPVPEVIQVPAIPISSDPIDFTWTDVITHTKSNYVALYSVLSKCQYELQGNVLVLYSGNNFYKKKLDDPKYRTHLYDSIRQCGSEVADIEVIPTAPPPKDSQAAAVAAIMGGGEEISLEE